MTRPSPHAADLASRLVRYDDLVPCYNAFVDTRSPGSEAKENFTIIGPGVSENPEQHVHIAEPHGFNIGGARQPPRCINSQHSHDTAEVFVVLSGEWSFKLGEKGEDAQVRLSPGDVISLPTNMFRGFENVGEDSGFLWAVLGGDDPGRVLWAPYVFDMAREYGLALLDNGSLIDLARGDEVPADASLMKPTDAADVARVDRANADSAERCVARAPDMDALPSHSIGTDVVETAIIGPASPSEGLGAGRMAWDHGFHLRRLHFAPGGAVPAHHRNEPEVLFVQQGLLQVKSGNDSVTMAPGDTLTIPEGQSRCFNSAAGAIVFVVRGGDQPAPAIRDRKTTHVVA